MRHIFHVNSEILQDVRVIKRDEFINAEDVPMLNIKFRVSHIPWGHSRALKELRPKIHLKRS